MSSFKQELTVHISQCLADPRCTGKIHVDLKRTAQFWGIIYNHHSVPNPVSINPSQHITNTQTLSCDWFYSRPMEAAEYIFLVDRALAWDKYNSFQGSQQLLTQLSMFDFCHWTGADVFSSENSPLRPVRSGGKSNPLSRSRKWGDSAIARWIANQKDNVYSTS